VAVFVHYAFVIDASAGRVVGWQVSCSLHCNLVLDALEQALHARERDRRLIVPSDGCSQHLSIRHPERLAQARVAASASSWGDSYDNALAETMHSPLQDGGRSSIGHVAWRYER